jgi:DNA-binding FadR family transcriptional regulator
MGAATINDFLTSDATALQRDLPRRTVREMISAKLAALITSGVLAVGDELPSERDLALAFHVSRETVRGAIQALAARGILEVAHGARTRVINTDLGDMAVGVSNRMNVDSYDIEYVHAARMLVEQHVVADAALRISDDVLARLESSLAAQQSCLDDPVRFLICDREFHVMIYRSCGNPLLADIATDLFTYLLDHRRQIVSLPGSIANSLADHRAIVSALAKRDRTAATAAFAEHERRIYTTTRTLLARRTAAGSD